MLSPLLSTSDAGLKLGEEPIFSLENLHPGLFVDADDQTPGLVETSSVDIQVTAVAGFRVKIGVMAMKPIHTPVGCEIGLIQNPPQGRAAHGRGRGLVAARGAQIIHTPARRRAVTLSRFPGGERDDIDPFTGGKSAVAVLAVAHPAVPRARARDTGCAIGAPYGDHSAFRRQAGDSTGGRVLQPAGSADNGTPTLAESHGRG